MGQTNKGGNMNPKGQQFHNTRRDLPHTNERNPLHTRDNTAKHRYQDYDEKLTNDENYDLNNPDGTDEPMDFRNKFDNNEGGQPAG